MDATLTSGSATAAHFCINSGRFSNSESAYLLEGENDVYVDVRVDGSSGYVDADTETLPVTDVHYQTPEIEDKDAPVWEGGFCRTTTVKNELRFTVWEHDTLSSDDLLGEASWFTKDGEVTGHALTLHGGGGERRRHRHRQLAGQQRELYLFGGSGCRRQRQLASRNRTNSSLEVAQAMAGATHRQLYFWSDGTDNQTETSSDDSGCEEGSTDTPASGELSTDTPASGELVIEVTLLPPPQMISFCLRGADLTNSESSLVPRERLERCHPVPLAFARFSHATGTTLGVDSSTRDRTTRTSGSTSTAASQLTLRRLP